MFDLISEATWQTGRALSYSRTETVSAQPLEDAMDISSVPTLVACGAFFALSFVMIAAFWFAERMRGANVPHL